MLAERVNLCGGRDRYLLSGWSWEEHTGKWDVNYCFDPQPLVFL